MKRGDIVLATSPGDYGKPRPWVIIQSDMFNPTQASLIVCPCSTHIIDAPAFRLKVHPSKSNGLLAISQIMADKIMTLPRKRVHERIGRLEEENLLALNRSLSLILGLAGP